MTFKVAVICYSVKSFLATLANVIAEGARQVRHCLRQLWVYSPGNWNQQNALHHCRSLVQRWQCTG